MTTEQTTQTQTVASRLAPPDGRRRPMKRNVFDAAQVSNTQLCPMFPYLGEGAILPAVALFKANYRGGANAPMGQFYHFNSVDEILLSFSGAAGLAQVGGRMHPVSDPLSAMGIDDPDAPLIAVITQRQVTGGTQHEAFVIRCSECHHQLLKVEYDVNPADADCGPGPVPFDALTQAAQAVMRYNADDSLRTCSKCGVVGDEFPLKRWGWDSYFEQNDAARKGRSMFESVAAEAFE